MQIKSFDYQCNTKSHITPLNAFNAFRTKGKPALIWECNYLMEDRRWSDVFSLYWSLRPLIWCIRCYMVIWWISLVLCLIFTYCHLLHTVHSFCEKTPNKTNPLIDESITVKSPSHHTKLQFCTCAMRMWCLWVWCCWKSTTCFNFTE